MNRFANNPRYAGFWIRTFAFCIDFTIISLPYLLFNASFILLILFYEKPLPVPKAAYIPLMLFVLSVICIVYFVGFNSSGIQGTVGKRVCNIFIGNASDASIINKGKAFGRFAFLGMLFVADKLWRLNYNHHADSNVWIYLLIVFAALMSSFLLAAMTTQKTALHDLIFKTRVYHRWPRHHQAEYNFSAISKFVVSGILLIMWGAVIPLFKDDAIVPIGCAILLYILFGLILLLYYKKRFPEIYAQFSALKTLGNLKPLFLSMVPTAVFLVLSYGVFIYVKFTIG